MSDVGEKFFYDKSLKNILVDAIYDQLELGNWEAESVDFQDMDEDIQTRATLILMVRNNDSFENYITAKFDLLIRECLSGIEDSYALCDYLRGLAIEAYMPELRAITDEITQEVIADYIEANKDDL